MCDSNIISVLEDGPLQVEGDFHIYDTIGKLVEHDSKTMFCRCGASKIKPFCDGSHVEIGFKDCCKVDSQHSESAEAYTRLIISVRPNGMLVAKGAMKIIGADGQSKIIRNKAALCRCGKSRNKPFCDVTHKKAGFIDDALLVAPDEPGDM